MLVALALDNAVAFGFGVERTNRLGLPAMFGHKIPHEIDLFDYLGHATEIMIGAKLSIARQISN